MLTSGESAARTAAAAAAGWGLDLFPPSPQGAARTTRQKANIPRVQAIPNAHSVYVHGSRAGQFVTDSGNVVAFERVVAKIEAIPAFHAGMWIRLVSCWSASSGLTSRLARRLGT